jgi:predicted amidohydrolase
MDVEIGSVAANLRKIVHHLRRAESANLVVFPECALTGYCFASLEEARPFAEPLDGPSARAVTEACAETGTFAVVGFIESEGDACYNAAMVVGPEGPVASYRKVHLPYLGVDRFLTRGNRPFEVLDLPFGKVGVNICYDVSFPEAARELKLLGAELIVLPTNWPPGARLSAEFLVPARALENHVNFAAVNRIGQERGWRFIGQSKVIDFKGEALAQASEESEEVFTCQLDLEGANKNRIVNVAGSYEIDRIGDRRPEFYSNITQSK